MSNKSPEFISVTAAANQLSDPTYTDTVQVSMPYDRAAEAVDHLEESLMARFEAPAIAFRPGSMLGILGRAVAKVQTSQPEELIAVVEPTDKQVRTSYYVPLKYLRLLRGVYSYTTEERGKTSTVSTLVRREAGPELRVIQNTLFVPQVGDGPPEKAPSAASILNSRIHSGTATARKF